MFNDNKNFYPTPKTLIYKMLKDIDFRTIKTVLEPSAGKGNIIDEVLQKMKQSQYNSYSREEKKYDIDCIEIDENLKYILQGKKFRVVHDNFLTYEGFKKYDLIVMNPPFDNGDKHLLKALEMQEHGGQIICILNSETIKNPFSNSRKELITKLNKYNATIDYLQEEFIEAERQTNVEIALIKVNIEKINKESVIINNLKKEEQYQKSQIKENNSLIDSDFIKGIIIQYQFEIKAGLNFINEYENLQPLILTTFKKDNHSNSILELSIDGDRYNKYDTDILVNRYIKKVRYKYWQALFSNEQFTSLLTTNLLYEYRTKITELQDYDFSYYNIKEIQLQMSKNLITGVEDTIMLLFEEFSYKHTWFAETSSNIHYYNGWKTNKAYMINKKVIIPLSCYGWSGRLDYTYKVVEKLQDIEKVFDYLDGGLTESLELKEQLVNAEKEFQTKNIVLKYFKVTFYKKGTCHITFTNEELLKKFNIFGSQKKGFLPPSYGKRKYKDMTKEEQEIINDFEGKDSYDKVVNNTEYYLYNPSKILMIG